MCVSRRQDKPGAFRLTAQVHLGLAEGDMSPEAISELNQALECRRCRLHHRDLAGTIHGYTMSRIPPGRTGVASALGGRGAKQQFRLAFVITPALLAAAAVFALAIFGSEGRARPHSHDASR